jgi:hypothetical protein
MKSAGFEKSERPERDILHQLTATVTDADGTVQVPGWYFWDETWMRTGPYPTREAAEEALLKYTENL